MANHNLLTKREHFSSVIVGITKNAKPLSWACLVFAYRDDSEKLNCVNKLLLRLLPWDTKMNMKNCFYNAAYALVMGSVLLTSMACPDTTGKTTTSVIDPIVTERCKQMSNDEDKCKGSKECTWDDKKDPKCDAAAQNIKNTCAAIQLQGPCDTDTTCKWVGGVCQNRPTTGGKTINIYTLAKIDDTDHGVASNAIQGLTASKNGQFVYLIGGAPKLMAYDVNTSGWKNPGGDWNASTFKKAVDHSNAGDLTASNVSRFFAPSQEGIVIQLTDNYGVVVIKGDGGLNSADTSLFEQNVGNLTNGDHAVFFASPPGAITPFIYLFKQAVEANSVLFKRYISPPANDNVGGAESAGDQDGAWNNSLEKNGGGNIDKQYLAAAEAANGNIFLGHKDGVDLLTKAKVGVDGQQIDEVVLNANNLQLKGDANNYGINKMAMLGDYLLVGLIADAGKPNTGGLIIKNLVTNNIENFGAGLELTIKWMATLPTENRAFIGTNKGLLIVENGVVIELIAGKGFLIDDAYVKANPSNNTATGFAGDVWADTANNIVGIDFDKNGVGYLAARGTGAADGGVFTIKVTTQVLP